MGVRAAETMKTGGSAPEDMVGLLVERRLSTPGRTALFWLRAPPRFSRTPAPSGLSRRHPRHRCRRGRQPRRGLRGRQRQRDPRLGRRRGERLCPAGRMPDRRAGRPQPLPAPGGHDLRLRAVRHPSRAMHARCLDRGRKRGSEPSLPGRSAEYRTASARRAGRPRSPARTEARTARPPTPASTRPSHPAPTAPGSSTSGPAEMGADRMFRVTPRPTQTKNVRDIHG